MADLYCAPFVDLIDRMRLEYAQQGSIFDLPARKWYLPSQEADSPDLSVQFHGHPAGTPVGPASGPHTQMAQNLVLSWLVGSRILELKTVQIDDQLTIGRPCIDAANVCYNIEFSQELLVPEALDQYVQGAMLIHMLRHAPEVFGQPFGVVDFSGPAGDTVFDMSVGYDLAGIRSDKVRRFIDGMADASESVERLRQQIPPRLSALRDLDYPTDLSRSVTLSTFHGCPAEEIERICEFLLTQMSVDTIVKMNPPMLGQEPLEHLLHDVMGYKEIRVVPTAYSAGLQFDESISMCERLAEVARSQERNFGAKFSNTLEVVNHRDFFPSGDEVMYLSGPPLHVITLTLADRFRQAVGPEMPISFSAGVDRKNFSAMVACGFLPVTTCTDLLKTGGYGRLPAYLKELEKAMCGARATTIDEYILAVRDQCTPAADRQKTDIDGSEQPGYWNQVFDAGIVNTSRIARQAQADERYWQHRNAMVPRRIDSRLLLFDCITCNKCVPVCPNDANFLYETDAADFGYHEVEVAPDGSVAKCGEEKRFVVVRDEQIANFADFCNECGNCDTFCPEWDGPYIMKPSFYGSHQSFDDGAPRDGFHIDRNESHLSLVARIDGTLCRLDEIDGDKVFRYNDGTVTAIVERGEVKRLEDPAQLPTLPHRIDMGRFHTLVALLRGVTNQSRVNQVNTNLIAQ